MAVHMLRSGVMSVRVDQSHDAASTLVAPAVYLKTPHTNTHSFEGKHFFQTVPISAHSRTPRKIRRGKRKNIVATGDSGALVIVAASPIPQRPLTTLQDPTLHSMPHCLTRKVVSSCRMAASAELDAMI